MCVSMEKVILSQKQFYFSCLSILLLGTVVEFNTKPFSGNNWRRNSMLAKKSLQKLVQDVEKIYINLHYDDFRTTTMCANIFKWLPYGKKKLNLNDNGHFHSKWHIIEKTCSGFLVSHMWNFYCYASHIMMGWNCKCKILVNPKRIIDLSQSYNTK